MMIKEIRIERMIRRGWLWLSGDNERSKRVRVLEKSRLWVLKESRKQERKSLRRAGTISEKNQIRIGWISWRDQFDDDWVDYGRRR